MEEEHDASVDMPAIPAVFSTFPFFGSYDHSIDGKGRIIIPTAYRRALGESFTLTLTLDDRAIAIYPDEAFRQMMMDLYKLNRRKPSVQRQQDHMAKFSYPGLQADSQGRVVLPAKLRQYVLGNSKDVEISGALDHVRICSIEDADEEDSYYREHRNEILEEIGDIED